MIGYLKVPVSAGGVGDTNHTFEMTYLGLPSINTSHYGTFSNYYSLFNNSKVDVMGISSYFQDSAMMKTRSEVAVSRKDTFPLKPLHCKSSEPFKKGNTITVYDSMGKVILQKNYANEKDGQLDLSRYGKGIYLVRITEREKVRESKVVVE